MNHQLLSDAIAIGFILAAIAAAAWAWGVFRRGPGPGSRLERLLDEHERDEAGRRGLEDRSDKEGL